MPRHATLSIASKYLLIEANIILTCVITRVMTLFQHPGYTPLGTQYRSWTVTDVSCESSLAHLLRCSEHVIRVPTKLTLSRYTELVIWLSPEAVAPLPQLTV